MRKSWILMVTTVAALLLLATGSTQASILSRLGPTPLITDGRQIYKFDAAFDSVNNVYLVVWGTQAFGPTNGMFLDVNGNPVSARFDVSGGSEWAGWARVIFAPEEGKFLVSYTKILGWNSHQRVARFVTYQKPSPSNPTLSTEIVIETWAGGAGGQPGMAYTPARAGRTGRFLVSWWNDNEAPPQTYVSALDPSGNILSKWRVTTPGDGQTDSEIACDIARDRCMIIGFSWGVFSGNLPATWGNYIKADTGEPLAQSFIVDSWRDENDASITFSTSGDRFIIAFARNFQSVWAVTVDGASLTRSAPYLLKASAGENSEDGGGFGRPRMAYNSGTQSIVVSMNPWMARSSVLELDKNGTPIAFDMMPAVSHYNNGTKDLVPAANAAAKQFMVADNQNFLTLRAAVYTMGAGVGGTPTPSPTPSPTPTPTACEITLSSSSETFGAFGGGGGFTLSTGSTCTWTAGTNVPWLILGSSSKAGTGNQMMSYSVTANDTSSERQGIIYIGNRSVTVTQAGRTWKVTDFNRDGRNDILWQNQANGQLAVWRMNGINRSSDVALTPGAVADTNWKIVGTLDANRDGYVDILWQHDGGNVSIWLMQGETLLQAVELNASTASDTRWRVVGTGDMDRNGFDDIIWQHQNGAVAVWFMSGAQMLYGEVITALSDPGWRVRGADDFDRDGNVDLVWHHIGTGHVAVWRMSGTTLIDGILLGFHVPDVAWQVEATADLNSDAKPDLIWRNTNTGDVAAWLMDGVTFDVANGVWISPSRVSDTNWKIVGPR